MIPSIRRGVFLLSAALLTAVAVRVPAAPRPAADLTPRCDSTVRVPAGFCAILFAQGLPAPRQIVVAPTGELFAASNRGGVIALRDTDGDGVSDARKQWGRDRSTGIALDGGYLYLGANRTIYRWPWAAGQLEPTVNAQVVVDELPADGDHVAKPILVHDGRMFVDFGSATNSCQSNNRVARSPGVAGCPELRMHAGIWLFSTAKIDQRPTDGTRWATGLRNPMGLALEPTTGVLWMTTHGRDQLGDNWGFSDSLNAELPAEEFGPVPEGADYGWPYCYYDQLKGKKVQAPEYGGDGDRVGECAAKAQPAIGFPGHWAPLALAFYSARSFPRAYRGGAFIAFHGSWNRAPLPQAGYRVVFVPFRDGKPSGAYQRFFDTADNSVRPAGVAVGPDGALYVSSDAQGKIWKVVYTGQ